MYDSMTGQHIYKKIRQIPAQKVFFCGRKISKKIFLKSPVKSLITGRSHE